MPCRQCESSCSSHTGRGPNSHVMGRTAATGVAKDTMVCNVCDAYLTRSIFLPSRNSVVSAVTCAGLRP